MRRNQSLFMLAVSIWATGCGVEKVNSENTVEQINSTDGGGEAATDGGVADGGPAVTPPIEDPKCLWGETENADGVCGSEAISTNYVTNAEVALSGDGKTFVTSNTYRKSTNWLFRLSMYVLETGTWKMQQVEEHFPYDSIKDISISHDGDVVATVDGQYLEVFVRTAGVWQLSFLRKICSDYCQRNSVAVSADGLRIAVSEAGRNDLTGWISIFRRDTGTWTKEAELRAPNGDPNDAFGTALSFSEDGKTLAVSAIGEDGNGLSGPTDNSLFDSGAVYVFVEGAGTVKWSEAAYIKPEVIQTGDRFGISLALSYDGKTLAVGADGEDSVEKESGAAYVFEKRSMGWKEVAKLKAESPSEYDNFGRSLSLSGKAGYLLVGAPNDDSCGIGLNQVTVRNCAESGTAFLFRASANRWKPDGTLKSSESQVNALFGSSVSISSDGRVMLIAAERANRGFLFEWPLTVAQ